MILIERVLETDCSLKYQFNLHSIATSKKGLVCESDDSMIRRMGNLSDCVAGSWLCPAI